MSKTFLRIRPIQPNVILGLDPGLARVGYAVMAGERQRPTLLTFGTLTTAAGADRGQRLVKIASGLTRLLKRYHPARVAIEKLFFQTNVKTAMAVSEARGALLLCCAQAGLPIVEFTPNEVKRIVTGSGNTPKAGIKKMIRLILGLAKTPRDDDAADAVAIALSAALDTTRRYGA